MAHSIKRNALCFLSVTVAGGLFVANPAAAQNGDHIGVAPAPPSIAADVPLIQFGPASSEVQAELIGPYRLLRAAEVDLDKGEMTLPLYRGRMRSGESVWYVVLDTTDRGNAEALGLNYSPKLAYAEIGKAVRNAQLEKGFELVFEAGTVDFSPNHAVTPGEAPNFFPPKAFQPGSVGDADYSPLVKIANAGGHIYNAPVLAFDVEAETLNAFCDGEPDHNLVHDKVVAICPETGVVTLKLTAGFSFSRPVLYVSTDASAEPTAALEGATYAPGLLDIQVSGDDSLFSPVERLVVMINGPTGKDNPHRQGLNSALSDGGSPLNVLGGIPTVANGYSPLWDVNAGVWTDEAIDKGYRTRVTEESAILGLVERGHIVGLRGDFGSTGFVVNCPIVFRFL